MANVTRWNPVRDMITWREAMDQIFNDTMYRARDNRTAWPLPMDAYTTENAIVLVADVPGLNAEDLQITLEGDTLTIRGEFKSNTEATNYLLRERMIGKFERTLTINTPIDNAKAEATFNNGVLTLTLPKADAAKPRTIAVKMGKTVNTEQN